MKKTVSVNIKGTNFQIEEDAYELLQDYIDRLTIALANEEGSQEIIEDIELRIAEICATKLNDTKTVIELSDIESILSTLGDPNDYVEHEDSETENSRNNSENRSTKDKSERRLFRDTENSMLGGVCAGFANYFNVDVVLIRVIFILLFFIGFAVPLYILLWIVVPKAQNTIDRLRMKGKPINVETVKEEVENAAERIRTGTRNAAERFRNDVHYNKRINRGKNILRNLVGIGFIAVGFILLISFVIFFVEGFAFLPVKGDGGYMSITEYGELVLNSSEDVNWMWIGGLMASIAGILIFFSIGILFIFRLFNKWTKLALGFLLITGISGGIICGVVGLKSGRDFTAESQFEEEYRHAIDTEQLVIIPRNGDFSRNLRTMNRATRNIGWFGVEGNALSKYQIDLTYTRSRDSLFHITRIYRASGYSLKRAQKRSENILYKMVVRGDSLFMDTKFMFPKEDKLRKQEVELLIEIPEGKAAQIDNRIIRIEQKTEENDVRKIYRKRGTINGDGSYEHENID